MALNETQHFCAVTCSMNKQLPDMQTEAHSQGLNKTSHISIKYSPHQNVKMNAIERITKTL